MYFKYEDDELKLALELNSFQNFITGNSATGKSYICNKLKSIQMTPGIRDRVKVNFNWDTLYICSNEEDINKVYTIDNSVVILDRLDMYCSDRLVNYIKNSNNIYILISRNGVPNLNTTYINFRCLKSEIINGKLNITSIPALSKEAIQMNINGD